MYNLGTYLKQELEKYNDFEVVMTRNSVSDNPLLNYRGKLAVNNGSEVFISLHSDAYRLSTAKGVTVFRSIKLPNSEELGNKLGKSIAEFMKQSTGITTFKGVKTKASTKNKNVDYYAVIRKSVTGTKLKYSFIIEHGFHTNKKECTFLNDNANLMKLASIIAKELADYFKVSLKSDGKIYKVYKSISGYSNAIDAKNKTNKKSTVKSGTYYIFREYKNGCINITTDKTCKTPGAWINPQDNKI